MAAASYPGPGAPSPRAYAGTSDDLVIVAEIGINHNGSVEVARALIRAAADAGCDLVKIQKREPDECVPAEQRDVVRETPEGPMRYIEYKRRIELDRGQVASLARYADSLGLGLFASVWDLPSVAVMRGVAPAVGKIPSALITDLDLCRAAREAFGTLVVSTGMSTEGEIATCVEACQPDVIMHSVSSYPTSLDELGMRYVAHIRECWPSVEAGYSGHEKHVHTAAAAVACGATWLERHLTLDRGAWGSDHSSSLEPGGMADFVRIARETRRALGPEEMATAGYRRLPRESEMAKRASLRGA